MIIYRCDKCRTEQQVPLRKVQLHREYGDVESFEDKELCTRCLRNLREWLKEDPVIVK